MPFDAFLIKSLIDEIESQLVGKKLEKINQPHRDSFVLSFRKTNLFISIDPSMSYFTISSKKFENPFSPPSFCMLLRKHLLGAKLKEISQLPHDRVITLKFDALNSLFDQVELCVIIEIMGRHSNIFLVDQGGNIIDCMKKSSFDNTQKRISFPGLPYSPFPDSRQIVSDEIILSEKYTDYQQIIKNYKGFSKISAILAMNDAKWRDQLQSKHAFIYINKDNVAKDFYISKKALELAYPEEGKFLEFGSISEAMARFYDRAISDLKRHQSQQSLKKRIVIKIERLKNKINKLQIELKTAEKAEEYLAKGNLILSNIHLIKDNMDKVELIDYSSGKPIPKIIYLDTRLNASQNAQNQFKRYKKMVSAQKYIALHIKKANADLEFLENSFHMLENSEDNTTKDLIESELVQFGYLKEKTSKSRNLNNKSKKVSLPPYRSFILSTGKQALVGKSNVSNDYVTTKIASKTDYWFHTKNFAGSHVVIKCNGQMPTESDIFEAAHIAAYYSKLRGSSKAPVDYCPVKNVRKPKGSKPGMVVYEGYNTILVDWDEELIEKLKNEK